jgi:hypothetical protein
MSIPSAMRFFLFNLRRSALFQRLQDPRVQVWMMAGFAGLLVLIGHVRAWSATGQGKNQGDAPAGRLLMAGARVSWAESFGPAQRESKRPALLLQSPAPRTAAPLLTKSSPRSLQVRPAMEEAASRSWTFLERPLRQQLITAAPHSRPLQIRLCWSGDARGNAEQVARHQAQAGHRPAAAFVIGNGSRSPDGHIEASSPSLNLEAGRVEITLIGRGGDPTARQLAALGELLHHLEAVTGHLLLPESPAPHAPPA